MTDYLSNIEEVSSGKFPPFEEFNSQFENLESTGADLYDYLEHSQQGYLQELSKSPEWNDLDSEGKLECVKDAITKFFRGTDLGHYLQHHGLHLAHLAAHSLKHII